MRKTKFSAGDQYGMVTLVHYVGQTAAKKSKWLCKCACGKRFETLPSSLESGNTKSCGCFKTRMLPIREVMDYNPDTGIFTARESRYGRSGELGKLGSPHNAGYIRINFHGKDHLAHRLAWLWMTGEWPQLNMDHINGCRTDNRWINLRLANQQENACNSKKPISNNSGIKGVSWHKKAGKWMVMITNKKKKYYLGLFEDLAKAKSAASRTRESLHGKFANHG